MKRLAIIALSLLCLLNVAAIFEKFNYLEPDQFKQWLETSKPMVIVDIQDKASFAAHHFPGSIETNAFPVKTDAEQKQIDPAVAAYKASGNDVVVVCPRGGGGAKRCYSYLKSQGVPEDKLTILQGGVDNWPYRNMLISN
ncbi:MAG: rhodanese-like domain-containing protein [Proteobacteria bacterium]|nr:rhodanese-like domain-containing protein [Pseudomonadota bacterium]MBU1137791.1 rhodanese-like domain-containing protein [Pseudomonadota bacterium]MBU1232545.1 rhodanese-like domain-containing protein [Pseudomonadota bacterium]MBU1418017.1 rhodanese-like domain-containing protein [Pseudomonadota bacterium]MBU1455932.1 rhodanese-like domain-containing protein [Pseudomonadota bacterium]